MFGGVADGWTSGIQVFADNVKYGVRVVTVNVLGYFAGIDWIGILQGLAGLG